MNNGLVHLRFLRDVGEDGGRFDVRGGDWSALRKALESAVYDGASDLADWTPDPGVGEYLLVSDGLRNYGHKGFPGLREGQALYALDSAGAKGDAVRLSALAEARGGRLLWQDTCRTNVAELQAATTFPDDTNLAQMLDAAADACAPPATLELRF